MKTHELIEKALNILARVQESAVIRVQVSKIHDMGYLFQCKHCQVCSRTAQGVAHRPCCVVEKIKDLNRIVNTP